VSFLKAWKRGATLITVLVVMFFVTLTIAAISYIFLLSLKSEHSIATYRTAKEAAEAIGKYFVSNGNFSVENDTDNPNCHYYNCISGNCKDCNCPIKIPPELNNSLAGYINVNATLLMNCSNVYTIKIEAISKKTGARTKILMVVEE
jgi:Tfp pilus assembly protein PilX